MLANDEMLSRGEKSDAVLYSKDRRSSYVTDKSRLDGDVGLLKSPFRENPGALVELKTYKGISILAFAQVIA